MNHSINNGAQTQRITITVLGKNIEPSGIEAVLIEKLSAVRYRDAYCIRLGGGEFWLFDYGVLVAWGAVEDDRTQLCSQLNDIIEEPITSVPLEQYTWRLDASGPLKIHHDIITLPDDEPLTRLALSHAFAQSAKIMVYEDSAQDVIKNNAYIPRRLSETGKVPLSRRELAKLRGLLFETISGITLNFGLLDTPEFFWDYPELEDVYQKLAKYLELQPRMGILDKKLGTLQNMLDMLAGEQNHKHSAFLEWVIIILIAVDIAIYFF